MITAPPLSLYIHFPWCVSKCPYCDFNSHPLGRSLEQQGYIQALLADLDYELSLTPLTQPLVSIFMGGGTPSLFAAESMSDLLAAINQRLQFANDIEITMEANPGTTEHHDFAGYRQGGINRLSIGVQSFDAKQLATLGRIHSANDAINAVTAAASGGFDNINIDLMFGLPAQSVESALMDLKQALALRPQHLCLYQLTIEPNTLFHRQPPALPCHDRSMQIQQSLQRHLPPRGFQQYEISAYSLDRKRCAHNLNYWQFGDYLGIGAGAHSKLTHGNKIIRRARKKHPASFVAAAGSERAIAAQRIVAADQLLLELLMNGLRLKHGLELATAQQRTGIDSASILQQLNRFFSRQLLLNDDGWLRCSDKGYLFIDSILAEMA